MKPTQVLQEIRKMRFEEAYEGWNAGRLTQVEAARVAAFISSSVLQRSSVCSFSPCNIFSEKCCTWFLSAPGFHMPSLRQNSSNGPQLLKLVGFR